MSGNFVLSLQFLKQFHSSNEQHKILEFNLSCLSLDTKRKFNEGMWLQKLKLLRNPITGVFGVGWFMTLFYKHLSGFSAFYFLLRVSYKSIIYQLNVPRHPLITYKGLESILAPPNLHRSWYHSSYFCVSYSMFKENHRQQNHPLCSKKLTTTPLRATVTKPILSKRTLCTCGWIRRSLF